MKSFHDVIDTTTVLVEEIKSLWSWRRKTDSRMKRLQPVKFLSPPDKPKPKPNRIVPFAPGSAERCLHCDIKMVHRPVHMVDYYIERKRTFVLTGYFCSWNCAKAEVFARNENVGSRCMLLLMLRRLLCRRTTPLRPCPARRLMRRYGGTVDVTDKDTNDAIGENDTLPDQYRAMIL
jgi:hypothetical protein